MTEPAGNWRAISSRPLRPFEYLEIKPKPNADQARTEVEDLISNGFVIGKEVIPDFTAPIDWGSGPRSYNVHLNSFLPLNALLSAYDGTSDETHLKLAFDIAMDWIAQNMAEISPPYDQDTVNQCLDQECGNRWYDMAIGQRLYKFAYILDACSRSASFKASDLEKIAAAISLHHLLLTHKKVFKGHNNHGFYQAIDQYAAASRIPELDTQNYLELARSRLTDMLDKQFASDDIHLEHSPGYHYMVTTTLINARNAGMLDQHLSERIAQLEHNLSLFIKPDGGIAPIGDTDPRKFWRKPQFDNFFESPAMQFIVSGGERGIKPKAQVIGKYEGGYAFARMTPDTGRSDIFQDQSYLIQHTGFHSRMHKHADHLTFLWHDRGRDILSDPGRYGYSETVKAGTKLYDLGFFYSAPERVYCESTRAHNCIEIDGESYSRRPHRFWGTALTQADEQNGMSVFCAAATHDKTVSHRRTMIMKPGHFLLVVDWLRDRTKPRNYRQWFCFDPAWRLYREGRKIWAEAENRGNRPADHLGIKSVFNGSDVECIVSGQTEPELLGWLSDRANNLVPATSMSVATPEGEFGRFATLFVLSEQAEFGDQGTIFNSSMRAGRIIWRDHKGTQKLTFSTDGNGYVSVDLDTGPSDYHANLEKEVQDFRTAILNTELRPFDLIEHEPMPSLSDLKQQVDVALANGWYRDGVNLQSLEPPINFDEGERSEQYLRHAWAPVSKLLLLFCRLGERRYFDIARKYATEWLRKEISPYVDEPHHDFVRHVVEQRQSASENFAWYDMASGQRCYQIAFILDVLARDETVSGEEILLFFVALQKHLLLLQEPEFFSSHNNHGLYQSLGRFAAAFRFKWHGSFRAHAEAAQEQLDEIVKGQFFSDGMHAEHSPGYHLKLLQTLLGAQQSGLLDDFPQFEKLFVQSSDALGWLITPNGELPRIGDTDPGDWKNALGLVEWPSETLNQLFAGKTEFAPQGLGVFRDSGYAVVSGAGSHLIQNCGFHSRVHKHADHLGFTWQEDNLRILMDPGRFEYQGRTDRDDPVLRKGFWYADERRRYVESTRAHNCVEIDGESYDRVAENPFGSGLKSALEVDGVFAIDSQATYQEKIRHKRTLIFAPGRWLVVLDWLRDVTDELHDFRQYLQLAPEWQAERSNHAYHAKAGEHHLRVLDMLGASQLEPVICGQTEPVLQGWDAAGDKSFVPATSLNLLQKETYKARFATLIALGADIMLDDDVRCELTTNDAVVGWKTGNEKTGVEFARGKNGLILKVETASL